MAYLLRGRLVEVLWAGALCCGIAAAALGRLLLTPTEQYIVIAQNDLGMHCMQNDFSQIMILPPFNTVRAQVIRRGAEPHIITSGVTVSYRLPTNTHSADKTNFWRYVQPLMGLSPAPDMGIAGFGLAGSMVLDVANRNYKAEGIPLTPIDDDGKENPYPLAHIIVRQSGVSIAETQAVVPISWEMSCNLCHNTPGETVATNILKAHDRLHATNLVASQPVFCAACHSDNALGAPGQAGIPSLSSAMHLAHAPRMGAAQLANECYACHPGVRTDCQRDVHAAKGIGCVTCHGSMSTVGEPSRSPWVQEPRCDSCHTRSRFEFEQPGTLFRNAIGHGGVQCITCHSSPHAISPAVTATDNAQHLRLQGEPDMIHNCNVCHTSTPSDPFFHRVHE